MSSALVLSTKFVATLRIFVIVFALSLFLSMLPAPAHAEGQALTEAQVQAVLQLLKSFNTQDSVVANVELALRGKGSDAGDRKDGPMGLIKNNFPGASGCAFLVRNLGRGSSGDDVQKLQDFLTNTGDLKVGSTTSFFGERTEQALKVWQARMGVANAGNASSTGFGAVGPKTRMILMQKCKEGIGFKGEHGSTTPMGDDRQNRPMCVLNASKNPIQAGENVTLTWVSKNASSSSTMTGGTDGPAQGSITVTPTMTSTYLKKVFGPMGDASCMRTVVVASTTPVTQPVIVQANSAIDFGEVFSLIGSGMASVMDAYLGLFGLSLE
jgi:peptidoglycan hydrolase-like protein with peptidoglycan-binding domain